MSMFANSVDPDESARTSRRMRIGSICKYFPYLGKKNHPLSEWTGLSLTLWKIDWSKCENGRLHARYIWVKGLISTIQFKT